jgi:hypothetical protein
MCPLRCSVSTTYRTWKARGTCAICSVSATPNSTRRSPVSTGAAKRLEKLAETTERVVYKDFAHSPSKLKATVEAVREQFPDRQLVACMELHTYSSLSENFLDQYAGCMDDADRAIVFYDPHAVQLKRLPPIPPERIQRAFARNLEVLNDPHRGIGACARTKEEAVLLDDEQRQLRRLDLQASEARRSWPEPTQHFMVK